MTPTAKQTKHQAVNQALVPVSKTPPLPPHRPSKVTTAEDLRETFQKFKQNRVSENTRINYESQWRTYGAWCADNGLSLMPRRDAHTQIAAYVAALYTDGKSPRTLDVALSAIRWKFREAGLPDPTVHIEFKEVLAGARNTMAEEGLADRHVASTISLDELRALANACDESLTGLRNRTLVLVAYGGWLRRSELLALRAEAITWRPDKASIRLPRSKTNQDALRQESIILERRRGADVDLCPYSALRAWLQAAQISRGPVFRHVRGNTVLKQGIEDPNYVYKIVQRLARQAGITRHIAPHRAFRASPITEAIDNGMSLPKVMKRARHRSTQTTTMYYDDAAAAE